MSRPRLKVIEGGSAPPGDGGNGMETRIAALEVAVARVEVRLDGVERGLSRIEQGIERLDKRLDRIDDKALTRWDVFQAAVFVLGAAAAAAVFVPRLVALPPS